MANLSLTNGDISEEWKTAVVRPLLKKFGLELIYKNYRPVSKVHFLSKPVERHMLKQLIDHCNENNLLPDFPSAYGNTTVLKLVY